MRLRHICTAIALLAVVLGCGNEKKASAGSKDSNGKQQVEAQDGVLAGLKNDAYLYSGLGQTEKLTFHGKLNPNTADGYGVQSVVWKENKDGSSFFTITRDGILRGLGTETVRLDKDGVYITGTSTGTLDKDAKIVPNPFKVGSEWMTELVLRQPGTVITSSMSSKVVGMETVTVPAGEFECLVVESDTALTTDRPGTGVGTLKSTTYYTAKYGIIKLVASGTNPMGDNVDIFLELTKIGD